MTFNLDKIREDPQAAYLTGVVLGFVLGYLIASKPAKIRRPLPAWLAPLPGTAGEGAPCAGCAEQAAAAQTEWDANQSIRDAMAEKIREQSPIWAANNARLEAAAGETAGDSED